MLPGLVLSTNFAGFTLRALRCGRIIERIGYIRAYEAAAATVGMPLPIGSLAPGSAARHRRVRGDDERVHGCGTLTTTIGTGEQPRLATKGNTRRARSAALFVRQILPSSRNRLKAAQRLSM